MPHPTAAAERSGYPSDRGGDPNAAFRMVPAPQANYSRVTVLVPGWCKSAGTLVALGAHELVVSDNGELKPLDVQMSKKDELAVAVRSDVGPSAPSSIS